MRSYFHSRSPGGARAAKTPGRGALRTLAGVLFAAALATISACAQVDVQETPVAWSDAQTACDNGGSNGGHNGGGNQAQSSSPSATPSSGVMDTYIVQIFELYNHDTNPADQDCQTCIATRSNCFIEKASCVCGDATPTSAQGMETTLKGVQIGLPATFDSFYCLRVMAVERTSESENCECDSSWEQPGRVRLCSLSAPYAASPVKIIMNVCGPTTDSFSTCVDPS